MAISEVFTIPQVSPAERRFVVFTSHGDGQLPQGLSGGALLRVLFGGAGATGEGTPQHGDLGDGDGGGKKHYIIFVLYYTIFVYTYIHMGILYGTMENLLETMWEMILLMMQGMEWANRFSDHEKTWETHVYFNDGWWMVGMGLAELRDFKRQDWDVGEHCGRAWMMETRVPMTWDKMSSALIRWTYLWHCSQFPHIFLFFWFFDAQSCTSPVFVNMFPHFSHDLSPVSGAFSPISPRGAPGHLHFADEAFRLRLLLGVFHVMSSGISPFNSHHSH